MMVQRLLILLVNKNNNMKCAIALDINEGKYPATVEQFGAKTIASNSTAVVHPRDLSVKTFYRR
jgi:tRNA A22 N-methylase